jgi:deoxyribodipyrimidine photo-lyase
VRDHAGLAAAARYGDVVPALVLDANSVARLGRNPRRAAFYCDAVASLDRELAARGGRLVCRRGPEIPAVLRLVRECGARAVTWSAAYDAASLERGRALQSALEEAGVRATCVHDAPAVAPDATATARSDDRDSGYRSFAPFFAAWSAQSRAPLVEESLRFASPDAGRVGSAELPEPADFGAAGITCRAPSESEVLAELDAYLAGPALQYRSARTVPAGEPTSRLSAPLSFGIVSARTVLARIDERARDPFLLTEERQSLQALVRALAQRDFFLQLGWYFEGAPDDALQPRMRGFRFAKNHPALDAWREGRTGFPLVDAGMRQLRATGWMHPRVRLVAASFLCFDLGVDWRVGRDDWERDLIEDDLALATGNWQWSAGVGADLAQFPRIYNPNKQARSFDPQGIYVRRWVEELANVPAPDLWGAPPTARRQLALGLFDGERYPAPVVDHDRIARAFLERYAAYTQSGLR